MNRLLPGNFFGNSGRIRTLPGLRILESSYAPNLKIEKHCHSEFNAFVVIKGRILENGEHCLRPNSFGFHAPDFQHDSQFDNCRVVILNIAMENHWIESRVGTLCNLPDFCQLVTADSIPLVQRLAYEFQINDTASALSIESIVLELMAQVIRSNEKNNAKQDLKWLAHARELAHASHQNRVSVSGIAHEVGVHPSHLARTFRSAYGVTLGEYIRSTRLDRAANLLSKTSMPISKIAASCGFSDQSHLCRCFRRKHGTTPAEYRARCA